MATNILVTLRTDETSNELIRRYRRVASRTGIYPDMRRRKDFEDTRARQSRKRWRARTLRWRWRSRARRLELRLRERGAAVLDHGTSSFRRYERVP